MIQTARNLPRLASLVWVIALGAGSARATPATIYSYPLPSIYTNSSYYTLTVNGTNIPVVNYTAQYDYAEFSMSAGTAAIQVTALTQSAISSYGISPRKLGLTGTTNGNTLAFSLNGNQYLIVSLNGLKPFVLCADPAEPSVPPSSGTNIFNVVTQYGADNTGSNLASAAIQNAINAASVYGHTNRQGIVYVPAGVYLCGNLELEGNMALYLQGGSVIRCTGNPTNYVAGNYRGSLDGIVPNGTRFLYTASGTNMEIYGRGTVDGNGFYMGMTNNFGDNLLIPINCTNFTADGITFRDAGGWGIVPTQSANVTLSNLKLFNNLTVSQDDCMDVVDSRNVTVSNVVAVAGDDTLSTKSYNYPIGNVLFENCLLWSQYVACKIGWTVATPQTGITYSNIVVFNCMNGVGLTEYDGGNSGGSTVANLTFDTIDVENTTLGNATSQAWGWFRIQTTNGLATNVVVNDVTVRQTGLNGCIGGIYSNAIINGITFDNIYLPGSSLAASNLYQMDIFNQQFYTNLTILPVQSSVPVVYLTASDPNGSTSFNAAGNWSNAQPPASSTNYVVAAFDLRTPTSGAATFAGESLTLYDGATLSLKNDNSTTTIGASPSNGLFLDNSTVKNVDTASDTLAGYVTLLPDGGIIHMPAGIGYTFTISAAIGGAGALQAGTSSDVGTIQLSGVNTYTGGTSFGTSFSGLVTLQLAGSGTLGATNNPLSFNSTNDLLDLNGTSQGIGNLSGTAGTITNSAAAASTLTIGNGSNGGGTFSGGIVNGNGSVALTKSGSGTIALSGSNTYRGKTTINGGTLLVNGSLGTNTVTVSSGMLGGNGLILGATTIQNGGSLSPGNPTGTLTISNSLTLNPGAISSFALGTNGGLVVVKGNLALGGTLNLTSLGGLVVGTNTLFTYTGALSGTLALGATPAGYEFAIATNVAGQVSLIAAAGRPVIASARLVSTNLICTGTGGLTMGNYYVLVSTNLALPFPSWTRLATNPFGSGGSFGFTNGVSGGASQMFYQIQTP